MRRRYLGGGGTPRSGDRTDLYKAEELRGVGVKKNVPRRHQRRCKTEKGKTRLSYRNIGLSGHCRAVGDNGWSKEGSRNNQLTGNNFAMGGGRFGKRSQWKDLHKTPVGRRRHS